MQWHCITKQVDGLLLKPGAMQLANSSGINQPCITIKTHGRVLCRQEASTQHGVYVDRKKENMIFTHI